MSDEATTPPARRLPVLVGLLAVALYLAGGVVSSVGVLRGTPADSDLFWLSRFKMFTTFRPHHTALSAEGRQGTAWAPLDLTALFPSRWQEGPGYLRGSFWRDPDRLAAMAAHACTETGVEAVRIQVVRWEKTLASAEQPMASPERRDLLEVPCAR